jgi:hypothetical protein
VHSFWVSDVAEALARAPTFALDARELIAAPKVLHHVSNDAQAEALRQLGVERIRRYTPGEPAEYLRAESAWENRLAEALR